MAQITIDEFKNFFKYYRGESHQQHAVEILFDELKKKTKEHDALWIETYRKKPEEEIDDNNIIIDLEYQSQLDNSSGSGARECFSSSCAMVAMYYGKVKNDDEYNLIRGEYGDTTDAQAQVHALRSLGLEANFITNATTSDLKHQIKTGRPTPCGWLHVGHVSAPRGGGHYSVCVGITEDDQWVHHDPNGEADLVYGGYLNHTEGANVEYSFKNWNPRWCVEGKGSGWMMDIWDPNAGKS